MALRRPRGNALDARVAWPVGALEQFNVGDDAPRDRVTAHRERFHAREVPIDAAPRSQPAQRDERAAHAFKRPH